MTKGPLEVTTGPTTTDRLLRTPATHLGPRLERRVDRGRRRGVDGWVTRDFVPVWEKEQRGEG